VEINLIDQIVLFARLGERLIIVLVILVACVLFMRAYRDKIQRIDLNVDTGGTNAGLIASFSMPVFLLLILIVFAFISFSNPVHYERQGSAIIVEGIQSDNDVSDPSDITIKFNGVAGTPDEAREWIRSLGVLGEALGDLDVLRQDGTLTEPRALDAIEQTRLSAGTIARLRLALLDSLYPNGTRKNCLLYALPGNNDPPSAECLDYVEDYRRGLE